MIKVTIILLLLGATCKSERILFLLPIASSSHVHVFEPLMRALGEKGHEVVTLSPLKSPDMPSTVTQIQLITPDDISVMPNAIDQRGKNRLVQMLNTSAWDLMSEPCEKVLTHPRLHQLLKTKFDLVIVDVLWNYCVLGVIPILDAPSIFVSTLVTPSILSNVVGNRFSGAFVPSVFLGFSDNMSFKERMVNVFAESVFMYLWDVMIVRKGEVLYRKFLPNGENLPNIYEIQKNTSLILTNSHFTLTYPRPLLPDIIEVAGMHTRPPKPLPKVLDEFLTGSGKDGFIFFSLGSIVKAKDMPEKMRKAFVNVFSRLKQRVIWKWDGEAMPDLPENVKISKWLPQQDILGHPNIKLFMSHGGFLSTQESVYHGVPVLGLPVFADQDLNIRMTERMGYGKFVEITTLNEEILETAINELLNNPLYSKKVKELSKRFTDLPNAPIDKAVYWVEYVLRHNGAPHLKSAARDLNFFQYYILDVVGVLLVILTVILVILIKCCKLFCRRLCGKRTSKSKRD